MPAIKPPPTFGTKMASISSAVQLPQNLHGNRALAGDHVRVIKGVDENQASLAGQFGGMLEGLVVVIAMQNDLAAEIGDGLNFDFRCGQRHHYDGRDAPCARRQRNPLRVIARRGADDAALGAEAR